MIICLDGIDGSGKTTLANQIVKELEKRYPEDKVILKHAVQIKNDVYTEYLKPFEDYRPGSGTHYVLDRWHLGENIYGPLYRGKSAFDIVSFRWIELFLATIGMRTWHVTHPVEVIKERLAERGEDFLEDHHVDAVKKQYDYLIPNSPTFAKEVSPKDRDGELIDVIIKDAVYAEQQAKIMKSFGVNFIGRTFIAPRTILVTENKKSNINFDPRVNEEFATLLKRLPEGFWQQFSFISAGSADKLDEVLNEYLWSTNPVAYGETVKARLKYKNIPFADIKPPEDNERYSFYIEVMSDSVAKV